MGSLPAMMRPTDPNLVRWANYVSPPPPIDYPAGEIGNVLASDPMERPFPRRMGLHRWRRNEFDEEVRECSRCFTVRKKYYLWHEEFRWPLAGQRECYALTSNGKTD